MYGYGNPLGNFFSVGLIVAIIIFFLVYLLGGCFFSQWLARQKGYSPIAWFFLYFVFGLIALITLCGVPNKNSKE
jgi:hypothetical protein